MVRIKTLLDLLSSLTSLLGVFPLLPALDLPVSVLFALGLIFGIFLDRGVFPPLPPVATTLMAIGACVLYGLRFQLENPILPSAHILVMLLIVRLICPKQGHHYLQIYVLGLFALASSSLLSLSAAFFAFLVLQVFCVASGLILLTFYRVDPTLVFSRRLRRRMWQPAAFLPVGALVLMLVFFAIMPRTQKPLWVVSEPAGARIGLSDRVDPGTVAQLAQTYRTAYRIESEPIPRQELYWRALVLNTLDGNQWHRRPPPRSETVRLYGGRYIRQTVHAEPEVGVYLIGLDRVVAVEGVGVGSRRTVDSVYRMRRSSSGRMVYRVQSLLGATLRAEGDNLEDFYLQGLEGVSPRIRDLALRLGEKASSDEDKVEAVEAFFLNQGLLYATRDLPISERPLETFLFEDKRGYCEYFASSFAVVLRLMGVPTRLVGGYYGGRYNDLGGYYILSEDTAHVWVEVLIDGERWERHDPSRLALNAETALEPGRGRQLGFARRLVDTINYAWSRTVITYDLNRQVAVLQKVAARIGKIPSLSLSFNQWGAAALAAGVAAGLGWWGRHRYQTRQRRLVRALKRRVCKKHRVSDVPSWMGLHALAEEVNDEQVRRFVEIYAGALYRDRRLNREELRALKRILRKI